MADRGHEVAVGEVRVSRLGVAASTVGTLYLRYDQTLRVGIALSLFFTGVSQVFQWITQDFSRPVTALIAFAMATGIFVFFSVVKIGALAVVEVANDVSQILQGMASKPPHHHPPAPAPVSTQPPGGPPIYREQAVDRRSMMV